MLNSLAAGAINVYVKDIIAMNPLVGNTIKVFREAPEWDKAEKLWQLREKNGKNFMSPLT